MARAVLFLGLALLSAGSGSFAQKGSLGIRKEAAAILERVRAAGDVARACDELGRMGLAALPDLFAALCEGSIAGPQGPPVALDPLRETTLWLALAAQPASELRGFLTRTARSSPSDAQRITGLELLARVGGVADLKLALELASPSEPDTPADAAVSTALTSTLDSISSREPATEGALVALFSGANPGAQTVIADCLARAEPGHAFELLTTLLRSSGSDADALLLLEIGGLDPMPRIAPDSPRLEKLRGYLGNPDRRLAVMACLAVEKLLDHEAVPDLIALLGDGDENVRVRACAALTTLTGLRFACDPAPWMDWLDVALVWWEDRAELCRAALTSGTASEAAAALNEAAKQRLFPHRVAELLKLGLRRQEADIVKLACRTLGALRGVEENEAEDSLCSTPESGAPRRANPAATGRIRPRKPAPFWRHASPLEM